MSNKPVLPFVEMMVTQACNLSCAGCTNYSDLVHNGYLTWEQGRAQLEPWLQRVDIPDFGIMGGEPLMNPRIRDWIYGLRQIMPDSQIRFNTNGLLLEKNFDVVDLFHKIGNCVFKITVHEHNEELEQVIQRVYNQFHWESVVEFGISRLKTSNNMRFQVRRPDTFYKTFVGTYENMQPHNNNPQDAFAICCQKTCPLIYDGKMYKCSTAGLLQSTLEKVGYPNKELWEPYLVNGLDSNCSDQDLDKFLKNFGKSNSVCRMCPTLADTQSILVHLDHVGRKKYVPHNIRGI
jgi:MoaA/NifB/PqqE/SkfB family radical SAM enzyme